MASRRTPSTVVVELVPGRVRTPAQGATSAGHAQVLDLGLHDDTRRLLTVDQAADRLGIGRTLLYQLLGTGAIESVHVGRLRRIPAEAITDYIDTLRQTAPTRPA